jgi:hypothetical protein
MKGRILHALSVALLAVVASSAAAFEANQVRVIRIESANVHGHTWIKISGNNTCANPQAYFIIERWDNQAEPLQTNRKQMYQLALTALATGKNIRVVGATCYLDQYLFAEQVMVDE